MNIIHVASFIQKMQIYGNYIKGLITNDEHSTKYILINESLMLRYRY